MKNDINKIQVIENYLDGDMTDEEIKDFEKELNINEKLRREVDIQKNIRKAFMNKGKEELKQSLNGFYKNYKKSEIRKKNLRILIPVLSAAASVLILIFVFTGNKDFTGQDDQYITLDSAGIHKTPEYADSSVYQLINDNDSIEIKEIEKMVKNNDDHLK